LAHSWPPHFEADNTPLQKELMNRLMLLRTPLQRASLIRQYRPKVQAEFAARARAAAAPVPAATH
jgi:hypothetical protein